MVKLSQMTTLQKAFCTLLVYAIVFSPWLYHKLELHGLWIVLVSPQTLFVFASLWIYTTSPNAIFDFGWKKPHRKFYIQAILSGACIFLSMYILHLLLANSSHGSALSSLTPSNIQLFMLIIYAPIAEEMFFRGILFQSLEKEYALSIAVILSSLLFMATHNGLFVGTFFLGLMTCYWTYQSRSIYPGIIFHAISNTFVLFAHHIAPNIGKISHIVFF